MVSINAFNEQGGTSVTPQYASPFLPRSIHHNSKLMFCHIPSPPQLPIEISPVLRDLITVISCY